jgi:hypothetical protein
MKRGNAIFCRFYFIDNKIITNYKKHSICVNSRHLQYSHSFRLLRYHAVNVIKLRKY